MAQISIRRVDYPSSMLLDLKVYVNNEFAGSISNNSYLSVNNLQVGEYEIYVSGMKWLYRSRKIKITITETDKNKHLITGPNFSIDKVFPLGVFAQGLIITRAYFLTEVDNPDDIDVKFIHKFICANLKPSPADVFIAAIPCLYFITGDFSFPQFFQFIGNLIFLIGGVFSLIVKRYNPKASGIFGDNPSILLAYSIIMAAITSHIPVLLVLNLVVIAWITIKHLSFFIQFPSKRFEQNKN
jgi:hypothetical protein